MKFKKLSMLAAGLLAFSQANALVIQVDVDNVDIFLNDNMVTAVDSITQIDLWDFNSSTFIFNGYDDSSYTLFDIDDHSSIGITTSQAGSLNGSSIAFTGVPSASGSGGGSGTVIYGTVGTVGSGDILTGSGDILIGSGGGLIVTSPGDLVVGSGPDIVNIGAGQIVITTVPEPSMLALLCVGLLGVFGFRRRSKQ